MPIERDAKNDLWCCSCDQPGCDAGAQENMADAQTAGAAMSSIFGPLHGFASVADPANPGDRLALCSEHARLHHLERHATSIKSAREARRAREAMAADTPPPDDPHHTFHVRGYTQRHVGHAEKAAVCTCPAFQFGKSQQAYDPGRRQVTTIKEPCKHIRAALALYDQRAEQMLKSPLRAGEARR